MDLHVLQISGFIILLFVQGLQAQTLVITPENKAVMLGSDVEFHCQIENHEPSLTEYISWDECISYNNDTCRRISNDGDFVYSALGGDPDRGARYSISTPQTGQYNLKITGVKTKDGGRYSCLSRYISSLKAHAQVIIFYKIICTPAQNMFQEDESVNMTCQVRYYGGRWIPVLQWLKNNQPLNSTSTMPTMNNAKSELTFKAEASDNNDVFRVVVALQQSSPPGPDEANNIPDYSDSYQFSPLQVWYSPRNTNIQPSKYVYLLGSVIECTADGNPDPQYTWIDTNTSTVIHSGLSLTITKNMLEDHVYICHASNDYGNIDSSYFNIMIPDESSTNPDSSNAPTPMNTTAPAALTQDTVLPKEAITGIGVGGGVIIFLVVIIIIICVHKKKKHKQTETGETTPSIPMSHQANIANVYQIDANFENDENNRQERRVDHDGLNNPGLDLQPSYEPTPPMLPRKTHLAEPNDDRDNFPHNPNQMKNLEGLTYADLDILQHIGPHPSRPAEQTGPNASRPTHEVHIGNSTTEYADIRIK